MELTLSGRKRCHEQEKHQENKYPGVWFKRDYISTTAVESTLTEPNGFVTSILDSKVEEEDDSFENEVEDEITYQMVERDHRGDKVIRIKTKSYGWIVGYEEKGGYRRRKPGDGEHKTKFREALFEDISVNKNILARASSAAAKLFRNRVYDKLFKIPRCSIPASCDFDDHFLFILGLCFLAERFEKDQYTAMISYRHYDVRMCRKQCHHFASRMLEPVCIRCKRLHGSSDVPCKSINRMTMCYRCRRDNKTSNEERPL